MEALDHLLYLANCSFLSVTREIIVAHLSLTFPSLGRLLILSHQHGVPKLKPRPPERGTTTKHLQAWQTFGWSLQHRITWSSNPWLKCEPPKGPFKKDRCCLSLYKAGGSSYTFARLKDNICRESDLIFIKVQEVRWNQSRRQETKKGSHLWSFCLNIAVIPRSAPVTVTHSDLKVFSIRKHRNLCLDTTLRHFCWQFFSSNSTNK